MRSCTLMSMTLILTVMTMLMIFMWTLYEVQAPLSLRQLIIMEAMATVGYPSATGCSALLITMAVTVGRTVSERIAVRVITAAAHLVAKSVFLVGVIQLATVSLVRD